MKLITRILRTPEGVPGSSERPADATPDNADGSPPTATGAEADAFRLGIPLDARPDNVPDNLWDDETSTLQLGRALKQISDKDRQLSKAQQDLRSATASRAPEEGYALTLPEDAPDDVGESLKDDPFLQAAQAQFAEWGLSQEQHDAFLQRIVPMLTPTVDDMVEALDGSYNGRGKAVMDANLTWIDQFQDQPEVHASLLRIASVAPGHVVLKAIRDKLRPPAMGGNGAATAEPPALTEEMLAEKIRERNELPQFDPRYAKLNREISQGYQTLYPAEDR